MGRSSLRTVTLSASIGRAGTGKCQTRILPSVTSPVRRAAAFAAVGLLALIVPLVDVTDPALATLVAIGPFLAVAVFALTIPSDHFLFDLFARPGDRRDGMLYGLAAFALAAAGIAILVVGFGMPAHVFVATVLLVAIGNLTGQYVRANTDGPLFGVTAFVGGALLAAAAGLMITVETTNASAGPQALAFLAGSGALAAALVRETVFRRDDALVMVSVALLLWMLAALVGEVSTVRIAFAFAVTAALGYVSLVLGAASIAGMLTGVLLSLLTIVLGGYGWFAMLVAFFGIGGLSAKYRYERKVARGVAQENEGARGTGNVLANSLAALVAVLAVPLGPELGISNAIFFYAFAGSLAAALADTLASEIGGLFDNPRLVTTLETVEPGTDGAITWQGEVVGVLGATIIAAIALLDGRPLAGGALIVTAGFVGMTVDSLLGSVLEGRLLGNQGVNFVATLTAALTGAAVATVFGVPA